jgi:predicted metalloprotease with PDZ domain
MPVSPGPLTLLYPKWIPGEHMPSGPIVDNVGVKFTAGGQTIPWRRDDADMFTYHLTVPPGVKQLEIAMDYTSPVAGESGFSAGASATDKLTVISWNQLLLYPAGFTTDQLTYQASLTLPGSWRFGTALQESGRNTEGSLQFPTIDVIFQPTTLTTLGARPRIRVSKGLEWLKPDKEARFPSAPVQRPTSQQHFDVPVSLEPYFSVLCYP